MLLMRRRRWLWQPHLRLREPLLPLRLPLPPPPPLLQCLLPLPRRHWAAWKVLR
jgi:hypothetical protein